MLFNSLDFAVFFVIVYALYLLLPHRAQNVLLLIASYFFYGCWDYRFLSLIAFSTTVDFCLARRIAETDDPRLRKRLLTASCVTNLGILGFFKYFNFFIESAETLLHQVGLSPATWRLNVILPVGISFYTFQSMSYTIDVYYRRMEPTKNFIDYALFVSLFTQLVAGPIERASHLLGQVASPRRVVWEQVQIGAWLFFWGLFKKVVVADNFAEIVDPIFAGEAPWTSWTVLIGVYAFALQIYCDFSAYSDMARGLGCFLGFDIMENFRNPYFATNPSDFWRRWHISLSTWLRDYLYIPLGGNRKGTHRTYFNLMATMLLGGLWHGAAWTFVWWGAFHGALLVIHRWASGDRRNEPVGGLSRILRIAAMFHAVCFSWLLFRAESMKVVTEMIAAMLSNTAWSEECTTWVIQMVVLGWPLAVMEVLQERTGDAMVMTKLSLFPRILFYGILAVMLAGFANTGSRAFIYFQF